MASSGERRMLFDTRGKRRHVIRVVYAILALLMGASLFLVVGPFSLGNLLGGSSSTGNAAEVLHEQAERIETRLVKDPNDEQLLLALTRARINAGNSQIEQKFASEAPTVTAEAVRDFQAAELSWQRYLKQAEEPNAIAAQLMAGTFFRLAESAPSLLAAEEYVAKAAKSQKLAAEQSPSLGSLSTLAIYQYFNGEFAAGDKTTKQVVAKAGSKAEAKNIEKQLTEYRQRGKQITKQETELAKAQRKASKESLENPIGGGLGGAAPGLGG